MPSINYKNLSVRAGILAYANSRKTRPSVNEIVRQTGYLRKSVLNRIGELNANGVSIHVR